MFAGPFEENAHELRTTLCVYNKATVGVSHFKRNVYYFEYRHRTEKASARLIGRRHGYVRLTIITPHRRPISVLLPKATSLASCFSQSQTLKLSYIKRALESYTGRAERVWKVSDRQNDTFASGMSSKLQEYKLLKCVIKSFLSLQLLIQFNN